MFDDLDRKAPRWEGLNPPYSTIVADPPWHYEGRVGQWDDRPMPNSQVLPYSTLTLAEIAALPVRELSSPGAHLYLWTTNRYLDAAFSVARVWGFDPITTLVWCKSPRGIGPGGRFTVTTEFVLFCRDARRAGDGLRQAREAAGLSRAEVHEAVKGGKPTGIVYRWEADDCLPTQEDWERLRSLLPEMADEPYPEVVPSELSKLDSTWFDWPRAQHSAKPAAFLDVVERVSPGPYVELFARRQRLGWDSWGRGYESGAA